MDDDVRALFSLFELAFAWLRSGTETLYGDCLVCENIIEQERLTMPA